jgi:hypothetical protein
VHHGLRLMPRIFAEAGGLTARQDKAKLREHAACVRWLLTGKGV